MTTLGPVVVTIFVQSALIEMIHGQAEQFFFLLDIHHLPTIQRALDWASLILYSQYLGYVNFRQKGEENMTYFFLNVS